MAVRDPLGPSADRHPIAEEALGHRFAEPALLREALTHRSAVPRGARRPARMRSNERLEFVGDRVLGLLMAEWLAERFPDEPEGMLARRLSRLVSEEVLAPIGVEQGLPGMLLVAPNEARAGVSTGQAAVADAMEAVLGAIYYDGGLDAARQAVRRAWEHVVTDQAKPPGHPKSDLKEWLEARGSTLPPFVQTAREGPQHAPAFSVTVSAMGRTGAGTASTKQMAERAAAADLLQQLQQ